MLEAHGFIGIFSLRTGGVSPQPFDSLNLGLNLGDSPEHVEQNLAILIDSAELNGKPHQARQVHGAKSLLCSGPGRRHNSEADILLTRDPDCLLAVRVADCLPVILADPYSGIVAAVHAGWRGTAKGVAAKAVQAMCELGANPANIIAALGPCIGPCCLTICEDVSRMLEHSCPGANRYISGEIRTADLAAINMLQLSQTGVLNRHMDHVRSCTCCQTELFFSHRRDKGRTGRHLAIAGRSSTA